MLTSFKKQMDTHDLMRVRLVINGFGHDIHNFFYPYPSNFTPSYVPFSIFGIFALCLF